MLDEISYRRTEKLWEEDAPVGGEEGRPLRCVCWGEGSTFRKGKQMAREHARAPCLGSGEHSERGPK